ncbi:hypothetical protein [Puniceibacterium sp. IMCC21224]|uniref:hypothetical protein n=1 Tax=Puniceibacterium sp. IMCC21224 TaxID=1618204 RepID=UPI00064D8DC9|nr:hypothetical protein [Puniceibacterium sp. IMCC21224]KMK65153.1 hypothetical protein IMCC21224_12398 [Puniceibacterium sp. IMCC21224]
MKRICFVGNSHVGAIKGGMDALEATGALDGFDITIFGSHGESLKSCYVRDGVITSDKDFVRERFAWTSGGQSEVRIADFDAVFVIAGPSLFSVMYLFSDSPKEALRDIPEMSAALVSVVLDSMRDAWHFDLTRQIALARPEVPVTHVGVPFRSEAAPRPQFVLQNAADVTTGLAGRLARLKENIRTSALSFPDGLFALSHPPAAVLEEHGIFTRHAFCRGSQRFSPNKDGAHPEDDFQHMNADYGVHILRHLLDLG